MEKKREDLYKILGVSREADADLLKQAYRRESLRCHPDRFPDDPQKAERFRELTEAYAVLSDATERRRYDQSAGVTMGRGTATAVKDYLNHVFMVEDATR